MLSKDGPLLTPLGPRSRETLTLKTDDLEDHVVSLTARNRYYHPVLGLRVDTSKGRVEQGNAVSKDARTAIRQVPRTLICSRHHLAF